MNIEGLNLSISPQVNASPRPANYKIALFVLGLLASLQGAQAKFLRGGDSFDYSTLSCEKMESIHKTAEKDLENKEEFHNSKAYLDIRQQYKESEAELNRRCTCDDVLERVNEFGISLMEYYGDGIRNERVDSYIKINNKILDNHQYVNPNYAPYLEFIKFEYNDAKNYYLKHCEK
jgi:hypothetical protein